MEATEPVQPHLAILNTIIGLAKAHWLITTAATIGTTLGIFSYLTNRYYRYSIWGNVWRLTSTDPKTREKAMKFLNSEKEQDVENSIVNSLKHEIEDVRKRGIDAADIWWADPAKKLPVLEQALGIDEFDVPRWAMKEIDRLVTDPRKKIPILERALGVSYFIVHYWAMEEIDRLATVSEKMKIFEKFLESRDASFRIWAVRGLGQMGGVHAVKLIEALRNKYLDELRIRVQEEKAFPGERTTQKPISWTFAGQDVSYVGSGGGAHDVYHSDDGQSSYDEPGHPYKTVVNPELEAIQSRINALSQRLKELDSALLRPPVIV